MTPHLSSYFAPAERATEMEVRNDLKKLTRNPVIDSLLTCVGGLLAVLNDKRQILTVNDSLLKKIGVHSIECILGQRLGEVLECTHAREMPGGCGTSRYCSSCGAVIAMVTTQEKGETSQTKCHLERDDNGIHIDLSFDIRTSLIAVDGKSFTLLFLKDITAEERWEAMEQVFFHDLNNVIGSVLGSSELLKLTNQVDEESRELILFDKVIKRLIEEVSVHRVLCENKGFEDLTRKDEFSVLEVSESLENLFTSHPSRRGKEFYIKKDVVNRTMFTNSTLLLRVLTNMLTNAFEATETGGTVRLTTAQKDDGVVFSVWNDKMIPESIALRVFQRNFSTKEGVGRGLGTFGMKLFGEKILGGRVKFETDPSKGTTFSIYLPLEER